MLELPSTRSADIRAGHAETGGGVHLDTGGGSPGDKWQLRELEQTQDSIAKETAKLAQEVQRLSKSVQESAKRVDAIPELLDTAPADGTGDSKDSVNAPVDTNVQAKAPIGTGESFSFIFVRAIRLTACFVKGAHWRFFPGSFCQTQMPQCHQRPMKTRELILTSRLRFFDLRTPEQLFAHSNRRL